MLINTYNIEMFLKSHYYTWSKLAVIVDWCQMFWNETSLIFDIFRFDDTTTLHVFCVMHYFCSRSLILKLKQWVHISCICLLFDMRTEGYPKPSTTPLTLPGDFVEMILSISFIHSRHPSGVTVLICWQIYHVIRKLYSDSSFAIC